MSWFTQNNDDDIDDIYEKLDDIYNRLEALDVVNAFSSRLSRLEKTSAYLESVLLDNVKELEKRIAKLEEGHENFEFDLVDIKHGISNIEKKSSKVENTSKSNTNQDVMLDIEYLKENVKSLKVILMNNNMEDIKSEFNSKFKEIDEIIKNLVLKTSYLELSKDRTPQYLEEIESLKEQNSAKDFQIETLEKKINNLSKTITEDSQSLKLIARYVISQADSMKRLEDELNILKHKDHS